MLITCVETCPGTAYKEETDCEIAYVPRHGRSGQVAGGV